MSARGRGAAFGLVALLALGVHFRPATAICRSCEADPSSTELVVVLDRSASVRRSNWVNSVLPAVASLVNSIGPVQAPNYAVRIGIVVFPSTPGAKRDDLSGDASAVLPLTTNQTEIDAMLATGAGPADSVAARTTLAWPSGGGWGNTPTWRGLEEAYEMLHGPGADLTARKAIVLVTDGTPSAYGDDHDLRLARPVYLTLSVAERLKKKRTLMVGLGINSGSWSPDRAEFDGAYPLKEEGGGGLFLGDSATGSSADPAAPAGPTCANTSDLRAGAPICNFTGKVTITTDTSPASCGLETTGQHVGCSNHTGGTISPGDGDTWYRTVTLDALLSPFGGTVAAKLEHQYLADSFSELKNAEGFINGLVDRYCPAMCGCYKCKTEGWVPVHNASAVACGLYGCFDSTCCAPSSDSIDPGDPFEPIIELESTTPAVTSITLTMTNSEVDNGDPNTGAASENRTSCADFVCPSEFSLRVQPAPAAIDCGINLATCSVESCCEPTGFGPENPESDDNDKLVPLIWWLIVLAILFLCCVIFVVLYQGQREELRRARKDPASLTIQLESGTGTANVPIEKTATAGSGLNLVIAPSTSANGETRSAPSSKATAAGRMTPATSQRRTNLKMGTTSTTGGSMRAAGLPPPGYSQEPPYTPGFSQQPQYSEPDMAKGSSHAGINDHEYQPGLPVHIQPSSVGAADTAERQKKAQQSEPWALAPVPPRRVTARLHNSSVSVVPLSPLTEIPNIGPSSPIAPTPAYMTPTPEHISPAPAYSSPTKGPAPAELPAPSADSRRRTQIIPGSVTDW